MLGDPAEDDGYYLLGADSLLGGQVVRKDFAALYTGSFHKVTDQKAIAKTLAAVQPTADQAKLLQKAKSGYAVSFITVDGKATKMYFVSTAYGYADGQSVVTDAGDLAYAVG